MVEMKKDKANIRRDCTIAIPPTVVEALGTICGKGAVEFVIFQEEDMKDLDTLGKTVSELERNGPGSDLILLRGVNE